MKNNKSLIFRKFICTFIFFILLTPISTAKAEESAGGDTTILLDGKFDDWASMPSITDKNEELADRNDLKELRYYRSNDGYLYIYLERYAGPDSKEEWDPQVVVFNGKGYTSNHYTPWDNKDYEFGWQWNKSVDASTIRVNVNYEYGRNSYRVTTSLGWSQYETTYSASGDVTKIEFRIPLDKIGLNDITSEIKFAVKSPAYDDLAKIDWIGNDGPIVVTQGSVFGKMTIIVALLALVFVGYKVKSAYGK